MKSHLCLIKSAVEYRSIDEVVASATFPMDLRGIYALYKKKGKFFNLVYIGMSGKGKNGKIRKRLFTHKRKKAGEWTHFSYYEVWDNVGDAQIQELEGLFRQLYRFDANANSANIQQTHKPLEKVRRQTEKALELQPISKKSLGL